MSGNFTQAINGYAETETVLQIEEFSADERDRETEAATIMRDAVLMMRKALAAVHPLSDAGCDAVSGLKDAIDDSGVYGWLEACCDAGILDGGDYLAIFGGRKERQAA